MTSEMLRPTSSSITGRHGTSGIPDPSTAEVIGRQHAEVTVAVNARWRHHGSEAVEQLERRQDPRATAAGAQFGLS